MGVQHMPELSTVDPAGRGTVRMVCEAGCFTAYGDVFKAAFGKG